MIMGLLLMWLFGGFCGVIFGDILAVPVLVVITVLSLLFAAFKNNGPKLFPEMSPRDSRIILWNIVGSFNLAMWIMHFCVTSGAVWAQHFIHTYIVRT